MVENTKSKILRMNPKIFLVWIFMISISMIFVSLISAYIVKKGQPGGFNVELPSMFYYSSVVVILSSVFKQLSYFSAKKDDFKLLKIYLILSFLFGLLFLYFQFLGWSQLVEGGIFLVGHPDGSFIYILSGVHASFLEDGELKKNNDYLEFKLEINELTESVFIRIIEYTETEDLEESFQIWDNLLAQLKEIIGA